MGCQGGGFFALFSGQPAQCGPLNKQIQQTRANLDRCHGRAAAAAGQQRRPRRPAPRHPGRARAERLRPAIPPIRQPQGRAASSITCSACGHADAAPTCRSSGTYRTICVRTCDGYYFPVSYSTVPAQVRRRREAVPPHVPGGRGRALLPPQSGRRHPPGGVVVHAAGSTPSCRTPSLTARRSTPPAVANAGPELGAMRCGSSTTRRSSAATSSCNRGARQGAVAAAYSTRRASRSGWRPPQRPPSPASRRAAQTSRPCRLRHYRRDARPDACDRRRRRTARSQAPGAHGRTDLPAGSLAMIRVTLNLA